MPVMQNWNLPWLAHNSQRRYPLANEATSIDASGSFTLPDEFLVSLYLSIPTALSTGQEGFTLRSVNVFATGFTVTFGFWDGSEIIPVATGAVLRSEHYTYRSYPLRGLGNFYDVNGHMTIGQLSNIDEQPAGAWTFDLEGGRLEVDCIRPQIRGVTQLRIQNGSDLSLPITGDVILRAGTNMRITPVLVSGQDPELVFDAVAGEGLNEDCVCAGDTEAAPPIKTINRIPAGPDGNFTLLGTECLVINPATNGLQLEDKCAKPCCGCKELETVTSSLQLIMQQEPTLRNFINNLSVEVTNMSTTVLGSKLGDQGCFS